MDWRRPSYTRFPIHTNAHGGHNYRNYTDMKEFKEGIFNTLRPILGTSVGRAIIYTIGHILIAMACNRVITGADWRLAGIDAIIEPVINGFWFYALDKIWNMNAKKA